MPKIFIPLETDDAIAGLMKVKPTAEMPRANFKAFGTAKSRKKKAVKAKK